MSFQITGDAGSCLDSYYNAALSNTAIQIGNDGGDGAGINIFGALLQNNAAAATYFQFFNANSSGAPTVGTTTADWTIVVPANSTLYLAPERAKKHFQNGVYICATTTRTGSTAPATAATVDVWFSQR